MSEVVNKTCCLATNFHPLYQWPQPEINLGVSELHENMQECKYGIITQFYRHVRTHTYKGLKISRHNKAVHLIAQTLQVNKFV